MLEYKNNVKVKYLLKKKKKREIGSILMCHNAIKAIQPGSVITRTPCFNFIVLENDRSTVWLSGNITNNHQEE